MKIKKYIVREMQEAMQLIREDLGPEAMIISTYPLPKRSLREIFSPRQLEVTAAVDDGQGLVQKEFSFGGRRAMPLPGGFLPIREENSGQFSKILRQREISMDCFANWRQRLERMEVEEQVIGLLLAGWRGEVPVTGELDADEYTSLLVKKKMVSLLEPVYQKQDRSSLYFLVGPTGVGKTFTVAKLATKLAAMEQKRVALICVSPGRPRAVEELKSLTRLAPVSVEAVTSPAELTVAVRNLRDKDVIFVDTEGVPPKNAGQMLNLKGFLDVLEQPGDVLLVLSCTTRNRDLYKIINDFSRLDFSGMIFTKLDETETYGSVLNAICYTGKPVVYVTCGLAIPDDLHPVNPRKLAEILLKGAQEINEQAFTNRLSSG